MKRMFTIVGAVMLAGASTLQAQTANPLSANMKASWTNIRDLLTKMAEKMPDENYRFKPTPEMQDFGQRMAHVVTFNMRGCATVKGEQKTVNVSDRGMPTRAEILAAMKEANAECDGVFNSLTDADAMKMINAGRGSVAQLSRVAGRAFRSDLEPVLDFPDGRLRFRIGEAPHRSSEPVSIEHQLDVVIVGKRGIAVEIARSAIELGRRPATATR